ncbi:MAG: hypothetical protein AAFY88_19515 [Acidobacteriota bacterium]
MPQDEILSNVLFGRGTGQISPIEAIQLAEAAAILSGVTGSDKTTIDVIRQTIGVDVLRVEGGGEEGSSNEMVHVGPPCPLLGAGSAGVPGSADCCGPTTRSNHPRCSPAM